MYRTSGTFARKLRIIYVIPLFYMSMSSSAMTTRTPVLLVNPQFGQDLSNILKLDSQVRDKMNSNFYGPIHDGVSMFPRFRAAGRGNSMQRRQVLVQTSGINRSRIRQEVENVLGTTVYRYIPLNTYVVEANQVEMKKLRTVRGVVNVVEVPSIMKLSKVLAEHILHAEPKLRDSRSHVSDSFQGCSTTQGSRCSTYSAQLATDAASFLQDTAQVLKKVGNVAKFQEPEVNSSVVS